MTKEQVLAQVRETMPGEYTDERIMEMIGECDQRIYRELLDGYIVPETGGLSPLRLLRTMCLEPKITTMGRMVSVYDQRTQRRRTQWA